MHDTNLILNKYVFENFLSQSWHTYFQGTHKYLSKYILLNILMVTMNIPMWEAYGLKPVQ